MSAFDEACRVRVIRAILGITSKEFAEMVDVNVSSVTNWEHGYSIPQARPRKVISEICMKNKISIRSDGFPVPEMAEP